MLNSEGMRAEPADRGVQGSAAAALHYKDQGQGGALCLRDQQVAVPEPLQEDVGRGSLAIPVRPGWRLDPPSRTGESRPLTMRALCTP